MMSICELGFVLLPWLVLLGIFMFFTKMVSWARKRKTSAIAVGVLAQMFLPDPNVEKTIEIIVEQKQEVKKQQDENGDPIDDEGTVDTSKL